MAETTTTQVTVEQVKVAADAAAKLATAFAGILAPEVIPLIVLGQVAKEVLPDLGLMVARWVSGSPPTEAEVAALNAKQEQLNRPETI